MDPGKMASNIWSLRSLFHCGCLLLTLETLTCVAGYPEGHVNEFIFAPLQQASDWSNIGVVIQAVTNEPTNVNISVPLRSIEYHVTLAPGSGLYTLSLPFSLVSRVADILNSTVKIVSDNDIAVVSYNQRIFTSDMFSLVPTSQLGEEYFIATYTGGMHNQPGVIMISAWKESVNVQITLTSAVEFKGWNYEPGETIYYDLCPFESLQLLPQNINITGTRVHGNGSIAVSVGCTCTNVPFDINSCDHISEQLVPFKQWGQSFTLSPFAGRTSGFVYQIVAGRDNTNVMINNITLVALDAGEYFMEDVTSQEMKCVTADKPILIMQYVKGGSSDGTGDPAMIRAIPREQYSGEATIPIIEFVGNSVYTTYLAITTECKKFDSLTVSKDNNPVQLVWTESYSIVIDDTCTMCTRWAVVDEGRYWIGTQPSSNDAEDLRFSAIVHGVGNSESYIYSAVPMASLSTPNESALVLCDSTSMTVLLDKGLLDDNINADDVHFDDENCFGFNYDTHNVAVYTRYDRCQTAFEIIGDAIIYSNAVTYHTPQSIGNTGITRENTQKFLVRCALDRHNLLDDSFVPNTGDIVTGEKEGYGSFSLSLDRYTDQNFAYLVVDKDAEVALGEPLYFAVNLTSVNGLTVFIENCWATPSPNHSDNKTYDFLSTGCALDPTLQILSRYDPTFSPFVIDAFTFIGENPEVFMHCAVLICDDNDPSSRCAQGCQSRRRRSGNLALGSISSWHVIAYGPLTSLKKGI